MHESGLYFRLRISSGLRLELPIPIQTAALSSRLPSVALSALAICYSAVAMDSQRRLPDRKLRSGDAAECSARCLCFQRSQVCSRAEYVDDFASERVGSDTDDYAFRRAQYRCPVLGKDVDALM